MSRIKNISASTLPEAIISLIILLVCFSIAITVISSLYKESISENEIMVHFKLQELKNKTVADKLYIDETAKYKDYLLIKTITPSPFNTKLIAIKVFALNSKNDTIEKQLRLIYLPDVPIPSK